MTRKSITRSTVVFLVAIVSSLGHIQAQQLVLPGDYPDPSVVKIGDTYWASATTSNWFPAFPLLYSKDLVNWKQKGYVFDKAPAWANYYFWAPEITYDNGKVYLYYSAHKKGGNLCLGVASANTPEGPYTDHGPLMCEEAGSIDAFPMRDEKGKLFMIWKEDGNSVNKPTPIWAMEMKEDRSALIGEKKELFRNKEPWERNLVEGVSMIKHGEYYYAFYAAAGCCGAGCTYVSGVARAKALLGPWEKYDKNPLLVSDGEWICPGHGTPVEKDGRYYFLYHGYDKTTNAFTGREGLLQEFSFTPDGWIQFTKQPVGSVAIPRRHTDKFSGNTLAADWQWSVFDSIDAKQQSGRLHLAALPSASGAFIGRKTLKGNYTATAKLRPRYTTSIAGVSAIGDAKNTLSLLYNGSQVMLVQLKDGKETVVAQQPVATGSTLYLQMKAVNGRLFDFFVSRNGRSYTKVNASPVDGTYLPPWDRAVRVGFISKGDAGKVAAFDQFDLVND